MTATKTKPTRKDGKYPQPKRVTKEENVFWDGGLGKWTAVLPYTDPLTSKLAKTPKRFRDKDELVAVGKRKDFIAAMTAGLDVSKYGQTVREFIAYWLQEEIKPHKAPKTYQSYKQLADWYIIPVLGDVILANLTPKQVQTWANKVPEMRCRKKEGGDKPALLAKSTVQRARDVLRNALNAAYRNDFVTRNAAEHIQTSGAETAEKAALDAAQAQQFLAAVKGHRLFALWFVALALGMRQGEILGLTWDLIDFDAGTINVAGQLQRVGGEFARRTTKSKASKRTVNLPPSLTAALKSHKARQNVDRLRLGDKWRTDHDYVFRTDTGNPFDGGNINKYTQAALAQAGLPPLTFHELRHSAASLLAAQGQDEHAIMRLLGHTDIRLTKNRYTHQFAAGRLKLATAMESILSGAVGD